DAVLEGQQMVTEGADELEGMTEAAGAAEGDGRQRRRSASGDKTSSVTTERDPGRAAEKAADTQAAAPSAETQTPVPGNQGFGKTGQQPDSVGDHEQAGTSAPVRGADGGGDEAEAAPASSAEQEKSAESVGIAS
ncbi:MAG: hypothetical protein H7Y30_14530, partial [Pyrinomonadaceae bacterium]|nr:hypothetical protein [Pyrinomonadaceae bacterium]